MIHLYICFTVRNSSLKPKTHYYVDTYHNRQMFCSCKLHKSHMKWLNTEGSANFVVMTNDFIFSVDIKHLHLVPCDCITKVQSVDIAACPIVGCSKTFYTFMSAPIALLDHPCHAHWGWELTVCFIGTKGFIIAQAHAVWQRLYHQQRWVHQLMNISAKDSNEIPLKHSEDILIYSAIQSTSDSGWSTVIGSSWYLEDIPRSNALFTSLQ